TMSDRLAVFNRGRIEQIGQPAEVYERPETGFVAGFVGVSNVLEGDPAKAITGEPRPFTIRPEKIEMTDPETQPGPDTHSATGRVSDVEYIGAMTRYLVDLDAGGSLVVMQQNLATSSTEALQVRGKPVRLTWRRENSRPVQAGGGRGTTDGEEDAP